VPLVNETNDSPINCREALRDQDTEDSPDVSGNSSSSEGVYNVHRHLENERSSIATSYDDADYIDYLWENLEQIACGLWDSFIYSEAVLPPSEWRDSSYVEDEIFPPTPDWQDWYNTLGTIPAPRGWGDSDMDEDNPGCGHKDTDGAMIREVTDETGAAMRHSRSIGTSVTSTQNGACCASLHDNNLILDPCTAEDNVDAKIPFTDDYDDDDGDSSDTESNSPSESSEYARMLYKMTGGEWQRARPHDATLV